jgi:ribosomal protein S18 acetylase RimI-like enzyme
MGEFQIIEATTPVDFAAATSLFRAYAASLDFSLEFQGFSAELAGLPGRYGSPSGCILLAISPSGPLGCVALRDISASADKRAPRVCEMKRLFVTPDGRGKGMGQALCEELTRRARAMGYQSMKLDTSSDMQAAQTLYRRLGFVPCARYNDDPMPCTLYFELPLV